MFLAVVLGVSLVGFVLLASGPLVRARRIRRASAPGPGPRLRAIPPEKRALALRDASPQGCVERSLADAIADAPSEQIAIADVNDVLSDLDFELRRGEAWPRTGLRLCLVAGVLAAIGAYSLGDAQLVPWFLLGGAVAAGAAAEVARRGRLQAEELRADVDRLVQTLTAHFAEGPSPRRRPFGRVDRKRARV